MLGKILLVYLLVINLIAFAMYGLDKQRAIKDKWRIPEKTLLLVALFGGGVGAFAGMQTFRHKTKHWKFLIGVPACILLHIGLAVAYWWFVTMR